MRGILLIILTIFSIIIGLNYITKANIHCNIGSLSINDTEQSIREKCGNPSYINASSSRKQWVYRDGFPSISSTFIYTENGHFSSAQWTEQ